MEEQLFNDIRDRFCNQNPDIAPGKMMSSDAITYQKKVFAFFSKNQNMVFKLGKDFDPETSEIEMWVFNPFKNRGPLNGWFEVPIAEKSHWEPLTERALNLLKSEL